MERSPHELDFNEAIRKSVTRNFYHIRGLGDLYRWARGTLLPSLDRPHPGENPVWGQLSLYPGGGYLAHLGTNSSSAHSVLRHLEWSRWLDGCSCAIFVEFTVYNANVNLFCVVTLLLETPGTGAFLPSVELQSVGLYSSSGLTQLACAQVTYLLLLLLFNIWVQASRARREDS
ncbi:unnamed protein product [Caretta caretta]